MKVSAFIRKAITGKAGGKSLSASASLTETFEMAKRYFIQETIGPLKSIGRILGYGLSGALLFGLGAALSLLGVLRLLQTETGRAFAGSWTFAPYLLTALAGLLVIGLAISVGLRRWRGSDGTEHA